MSDERVRISVEDHVAVVTLTRPDKHNALDAAMFEGILGAAEEVGNAPGVRAVVLHGEGPSFCSGLDIAGFMTEPGETTDLLGRLDDRLEHRAVERVVLLRARQAHIGDVILDLDDDTLLTHGAQPTPADSPVACRR